MLNKEVKIILSKDAKEVFDHLVKESRHSKIELSILRSIQQKKGFLKQNPQYGDPISKNLIPQEYIEKYAVTNLFRIELPNYWRMFYTLEEGETKIEILAFVLDIMDHKKYNKKFKYS